MIESPINVEKWIKENEGSFSPPVMNKLMYNEDLQVMFVGGPNERDDYHLQVGEELFYMVRGDMCLKVIEKNKPKDIIIKEGEVFLLPALIPHSPQRFKDTVGLVIERIRKPDEYDSMKWYVGDQVLYEEFFHCKDLVVDLKPIIQRFKNSVQYKTRIPDPNSFIQNPPITPNSDITLDEPFNLKEWVNDYISNNEKGIKELFGKNEFSMIFYHCLDFDSNIYNKNRNQCWIWQWEGQSVVELLGTDKRITLEKDDCYLVDKDQPFHVKMESTNSSGFVVTMTK